MGRRFSISRGATRVVFEGDRLETVLTSESAIDMKFWI